MNTATYPYRWIYMPYCLKRQANGSYLVLNKKYWPLGCWDDNPTANSIIIPAMNKKLAAALSVNQSDNLEQIYLYSAAPVQHNEPATTAYLKRVCLLLELSTQPSTRDAPNPLFASNQKSE